MTEEDVIKALEHWHDDRHLTWREIATLPSFHGISFGTLNTIYNTKKIEHPIVRDRLGLPPKESCGMCYVFNRYIGQARKKYKVDRFNTWPTSVLRSSLLNREEV